MFGYYDISATSLLIKPLIAPNMNLPTLPAYATQLLQKLDALAVPSTANFTSHSSFLEGYPALFDGEGAGVNMLTSSRLILQEHVEKNSTAVTEAFRFVAQ